MKTHTNISIDSHLLAKAKVLGLNVSGLTQSVLRGVIGQYSNAEIDVFELKKEIELIEKKQTELQTRKQELLTQVIAFEEKQAQNKQKDLKQQLQEAELVKQVIRDAPD